LIRISCCSGRKINEIKKWRREMLSCKSLTVGIIVMLLSVGLYGQELTSPTVTGPPSMEELLYQAGSNYQSSGQVDKAVGVFEQLVKEHAESDWAGCALSRLGEIYVSREENEKAIESWKRSIEEYKEAKFDDGVEVVPVSMFHLAFHYESAGMLEEAIKWYSELGSQYGEEIAHNGRKFGILIDFRLRLIRDRKKFSEEELAEINQKYQKAGENLYKKESAELLKEIIDKYPGSNLAGCAAVLLGQAYAQMGGFRSAERYLLLAKSDHRSSYFSNGARVGPLADFYLALLYRDRGNAMFENIKQDYPDAIDLQGRSLPAVVEAITRPVISAVGDTVPVHRPVKKKEKEEKVEETKTE
jgi:TolA-binding protein